MQRRTMTSITDWVMTRLTEMGEGKALTTESRLCADLGLDSLDSVELVMAIEEEFGIEIPDTEWEGGHDRTVAEVVDLIYTKLAVGGDHVRS